MRIEKEYSFKDIKSTIFYWNNKYILKFEYYDMEQTYKFSEFDYSLDELEDLLNENFLADVKATFLFMSKNLQKTI